MGFRSGKIETEDWSSKKVLTTLTGHAPTSEATETSFNATADEPPDHRSYLGMRPAVLQLMVACQAAGNNHRIGTGPCRQGGPYIGTRDLMVDECCGFALCRHLHCSDQSRNRQGCVRNKDDIDCSCAIAVLPSFLSGRNRFACPNGIGDADGTKTFQQERA